MTCFHRKKSKKKFFLKKKKIEMADSKNNVFQNHQFSIFFSKNSWFIRIDWCEGHWCGVRCVEQSELGCKVFQGAKWFGEQSVHQLGLYDMPQRVKPRNEQLTQTIDMICVPWSLAHPKVNATLKMCNVQKLIERSCIQSIFHKR